MKKNAIFSANHKSLNETRCPPVPATHTSVWCTCIFLGVYYPACNKQILNLLVAAPTHYEKLGHKYPGHQYSAKIVRFSINFEWCTLWKGSLLPESNIHPACFICNDLSSGFEEHIGSKKSSRQTGSPRLSLNTVFQFTFWIVEGKTLTTSASDPQKSNKNARFSWLAAT
jgi:hypothetical protein